MVPAITGLRCPVCDGWATTSPRASVLVRSPCLSDYPPSGRGATNEVACRRGLLVSVEGISGVGKTYLTEQLGAEIARNDASGLLTMKGFSERGASVQGSLG